MAEIIGHWSNLAEAQKLTQSVLLSGVVETVIENNQLMPLLPVKQLNGKSLQWNRELETPPEEGGDFYGLGDQLVWQSDQAYEPQKEANTKILARQDPDDTYVSNTYSNINDMDAERIRSITKKFARKAEHTLFYGDTKSTALAFDGLHRLNIQEQPAAVTAAAADVDDTNIDNGADVGLSLHTLRVAMAAAKIDILGPANCMILMPRELKIRFNSAWQEGGFVNAGVTVAPMMINVGMEQVGTPTLFFDGVPLVATPFLRAEQVNSGTPLAARRLHSSGAKAYSIFIIRMGTIEEGGLEMLYGDPAVRGSSNLPNDVFAGIQHYRFDQLENRLGGGDRVWAFLAPILGAAHSLVRIYDISDHAIRA